MKLGLVGDVMIGRLVNGVRHSVWGDVLPCMKGCDAVLANLETALTRGNKAVPKVFNFKSDPEHISWLKEANIQAVNLANNHLLDFSEEGLFDTLAALEGAKILHTGAGKNFEEASKPLFLSKAGVKIAVFGYTDNEPSWLAGKTQPGTNFIEIGDVSRVQEDIEKVKESVDLIIVSLHWGPNMVERPPKSFMNFAHELIDSGVHLIHGHSAHIFQGVERYKNGLIIYDCGDFIDDYYVDPYLRNDRSFFFEVECDKKGIRSLVLRPVLISNMCVNLATGYDKAASLKRMKLLSEELGTLLREESDVLTCFD